MLQVFHGFRISSGRNGPEVFKKLFFIIIGLGFSWPVASAAGSWAGGGMVDALRKE